MELSPQAGLEPATLRVNSLTSVFGSGWFFVGFARIR